MPGETAALCCCHKLGSCWSPDQRLLDLERVLLLCLTDANCTVRRPTVNSVCSFACSQQLFVSGSVEPLMSTAAQAETRRRDRASAPCLGPVGCSCLKCTICDGCENVLTASWTSVRSIIFSLVHNRSGYNSLRSPAADKEKKNVARPS